MSLALFPLNTVLFPGCTLDLQLFEARYLDMISRCMKKGEGFGARAGAKPPRLSSLARGVMLRQMSLILI